MQNIIILIKTIIYHIKDKQNQTLRNIKQLKNRLNKKRE
jgi:hypothetical protein